MCTVTGHCLAQSKSSVRGEGGVRGGEGDNGRQPGSYGVSTMDSVHAPSTGVETDKPPGLAEPPKQWC